MKTSADRLLERLGTIILGKPGQLRLALACLLANGHLLIEDVPGVGKTTLSLAFARVLGLRFQRVQFTSDLMPADLLGVSVYEANQKQFRFHHGPIFAQLVLVDEINRANPKTQSALLEAMEERQITVEGATRMLPDPFFVIATQNPHGHAGTFPLPESQLDRFMMRLSIGYPASVAERMLLAQRERRQLLHETAPILDTDQLLDLIRAGEAIRTAPALLDYILALVHASRQHPAVQHGLSPRAGIAMRRAAQAWALIDGRDAVIPEDVQAVFTAIANHRLITTDVTPNSASIADELLATVAIP